MAMAIAGGVVQPWPISALARRFAKFGLVGTSGAGVNLALFWLLTSRLHAHHLIAAPLAFEVALCSNYLMNNTWTFADRRPAACRGAGGVVSLAGLLRYQVAALGGLLVNLAVLHAALTGLGLEPLLANVTGIGAAMLWNFALSIGWTWRADAGASPMRHDASAGRVQAAGPAY